MTLCLHATAVVHATAVAWHGRGILIRGPSGGGKSTLALGLIDRGALLVGDDQVVLQAVSGALVMAVPAPLAGVLEVRGVGLIRFPYLLSARLALVVDLVPPARIERLPDFASTRLLDIRVPVLAVAAGDGLAPLRVTTALRGLREI